MKRFVMCVVLAAMVMGSICAEKTKIHGIGLSVPIEAQYWWHFDDVLLDETVSTVGINLNERMEAISMGLVSVNKKPFTRSGILRGFSELISRRDQLKDSEEWDGSMSFHPADDSFSRMIENAGQGMFRMQALRNPVLAATLASVPADNGARDLPRTMDGAMSGLVSALVRKLRDTLSKYTSVSIREMTDLIPELQGRFPIRVELEPLSWEHLQQILTEPENSLIRQYEALISTEGTELSFTDEATAEIARLAHKMNSEMEDIGARRLHTMMEQLLEEISFNVSDIDEEKIEITADMVKEKLSGLVENRDIRRYLL